MKRNKLSFLFLLIILLALASCKTTSSFTIEQLSPWETFEITSGENESKTATWHCIKIDLDTPNLEIQLIPENQDYKSEYIETFAKKYKALIAINTTPFTKDKKILGITKNNNSIISAPIEKYSALCFSTVPLRAHILENQKSSDLEKFDIATGGFFTILKDGNILSYKKNKHSRAAAGISHDGRYLYLFATTPKSKLFDKDGMTYEECAIILKQEGCTDALQFDGGHSTGLYFNSKILEKPKFQRKVPSVIVIK